MHHVNCVLAKCKGKYAVTAHKRKKKKKKKKRERERQLWRDEKMYAERREKKHVRTTFAGG